MRIGPLLVVATLALGLMAAVGCPARAAQASWTVMVYLDGDNNLESAGIADVNQMEMAPTSPQVNVLVQFDRIRQFVNDDTSNGDWSSTRRYLIAHDTDPLIINSTLLEDLGELNMGDPAVLEDFVKWGIQNYPADHYALILWDHGSGWKALSLEGEVDKAICYDDTSDDQLTLVELQQALAGVRESLGRPLDVLACDACIMADVEVAYSVRSEAGYFVASQENVPNDGFAYDDLLTRLAATPTMAGRDLSEAMVSSYRASYDHGSQGYYAVTLSATDLSRMGEVATALSGFANALEDTTAGLSTYGANLHTWWELSRVNGDLGQVDLVYFTDLVRADAPNEALRNAAETLLSVLGESIVANGVVRLSPISRRGLGIYYPFGMTYDTRYSALELARDTTWEEFLRTSPVSYDYVPDHFEPDDTLAQASEIRLCVPQTRHWFHVADDVDIATFSAEAGKQYYVVTENLGSNCDTKLMLMSADETVVAVADVPGRGASQLSWSCPASGTYAVSVTQSATGGLAGYYGSNTAYDLYASPISFADVSPSYWAFRQIESCTQAGIVMGYDDGYHPGEAVDRAQMATYVARVLANGDADVIAPPEGTQSFSDVTPDYWAFRYVEYCKTAQVVSGYDGGQYHPTAPVDRGQMAVFIARAREPQSERPYLPSYTPPAVPSFPDVSTGFWAYREIEYCAEHGVASGYPDGYHPELTVTRDQMAVYVVRAFGLTM